MLKIIKNPDKKTYDEVTQAVKDNDNYCPCKLERSQDSLCICREFREQNEEGECCCGRYVKVNADA